MPESITVSRKVWQSLYTCSYTFDNAQSKPGASKIHPHALHEHGDHGRFVITHSGRYASFTEGGVLITQDGGNEGLNLRGEFVVLGELPALGTRAGA